MLAKSLNKKTILSKSPLFGNKFLNLDALNLKPMRISLFIIFISMLVPVIGISQDINIKWVYYVENTIDNNGSFNDFVRGKSGNFYITANLPKPTVICVDSIGTEIWRQEFLDKNSISERIFELRNGNILVLISSFLDLNLYELKFIILDPNGKIISDVIIPGSQGERYTHTTEILSDFDDHLYVSGVYNDQGKIFHFLNEGLEWVNTTFKDEIVHALKKSSDGSIYCVYGDENFYFGLSKLNNQGEEIWRIDSLFFGGFITNQIITTSDLGVVLMGYDKRHEKTMIVKFNKDGQKIWENQILYPNLSTTFYDAGSILTDENDNLYTYYSGIPVPNAPYPLGLVEKYNKDGKLLWQKSFTNNVKVESPFKRNENMVLLHDTLYVFASPGIIIKLDSAGNVLFKDFVNLDGKHDYYVMAIEKSNDEIIFAGNCRVNGIEKGYIASMSSQVALEKEEIDDPCIGIFPNPFNDVIKIKLPDNCLLVSEFKIYNSNGLVVKSDGNLSTTNSVNTFDLIPGFYYVTIKSGEDIFIKKLIKF